MASDVISTPLLQATAVAKSFGQVAALGGVDLTLDAHSIHAIIGENGAGKSTFAKVIAGEIQADSGQILIRGLGPNPRNPRDAGARGVGLVHQEFLLAKDLTVWENVLIGWEGTGFFLDRSARASVAALATAANLSVPVDEKVSDLPIAMQQRVEILKALYRGADIILFDEPTAVLTPSETRGLFDAMRELRDQGKALVFVSHKLKEVLEISDTITVMRAGEVVATVTPGEVSELELATLLVGQRPQAVERVSRAAGRVVLEVAAISSPAYEGSSGLTSCSLTVRQHEVVGIAGVSGNGQDELVEILSGHRSPTSGTATYLSPEKGIEIDSRSVVGSPAAVLRAAGLGYVPADRLHTASAPGQPLWFSMIAARLTSKWPLSGIRAKVVKADAERVRVDYGVRADSVRALPDQLSGGNLQKFILGRELSRHPTALIAHEPTRGIDIGSARQLRQNIRDLVDRDACVLLVSSDLDELVETCDRLLVLANGRIVAEFDPAVATLAEIGQAMTASAGAS